MLDAMFRVGIRYQPWFHSVEGLNRDSRYSEEYKIAVGDIRVENLRVVTEAVDHRDDSGFVWVETTVKGDYINDDSPVRPICKLNPYFQEQNLHTDSPDSLDSKVAEQHWRMIRFLQTYFVGLPCQN
ncbi:hypothetical protein A3K72_03430 [Candidatus Woesearchaeota archaeon RBG_13_36_6]|nr:MAG: hypothetical protein A3K72_03430 [Candidatus Woesearchaeota archaeon RBG_13_36_6]